MTNIVINENSGAATGGVRDLLRWEGVALFVGMTLFYWISGRALADLCPVFLRPGPQHAGLSGRPADRRGGL